MSDYSKMAEKRYHGIDKDPNGAMNPTGNIIRDAWVFGLIPETETCEGWLVQGIDALYDKVTTEWEKYGHLVSNLPPELAEKHKSYLAIENHGNALLCSQDSFKAFVDNNTSSRLGIALAPYHVQRQKESVTEAIRICGKQLLFFYAWQSYKGLEQLPGIGPTDMTPWMRAPPHS